MNTKIAGYLVKGIAVAAVTSLVVGASIGSSIALGESIVANARGKREERAKEKKYKQAFDGIDRIFQENAKKKGTES